MLDRHQYVEKLKARLTEWDRDLDIYETRLKETSDEVKQRSQLALADLKATRQQLGKSFTELADVSDDAWQKMHLGLDKAWESVKSGLLAVRAELLPTDSTPKKP